VKISEEQIREILEASQYIVGIHTSIYKDYLKATDGDKELSLKLAKDNLEVLLWGNQKGGK